MKTFKKIMGGIAAIEKFILCIISVVVTVITFANVCVRKLTETQFAWSEELVINLFVLMIMLGCALCAREGSLISLSLIFDLLGKKGKKILVAIGTVFSCGFYGVLFKTGLDKVLTQISNGKTTFSLGWPEWVFTIFLPIGCALLILHTVEFFLDEMFDKAEETKETEDEA